MKKFEIADVHLVKRQHMYCSGEIILKTIFYKEKLYAGTRKLMYLQYFNFVDIFEV